MVLSTMLPPGPPPLTPNVRTRLSSPFFTVNGAWNGSWGSAATAAWTLRIRIFVVVMSGLSGSQSEGDQLIVSVQAAFTNTQ
jgi:hypothetical protein